MFTRPRFLFLSWQLLYTQYGAIRQWSMNHSFLATTFIYALANLSSPKQAPLQVLAGASLFLAEWDMLMPSTLLIFYKSWQYHFTHVKCVFFLVFILVPRVVILVLYSPSCSFRLLRSMYYLKGRYCIDMVITAWNTLMIVPSIVILTSARGIYVSMDKNLLR